jgi:hypothetical protein
MLGWLRRIIRPRRDPPQPEIRADEDGVAVTLGAENRRVAWKDVGRIVAWKRDLLTTDEILLRIDSADTPDQSLTLSEEWPGFTTLFGPMERILGVSPAWYREIMTPAFEPRPRILYDRTLDS